MPRNLDKQEALKEIEVKVSEAKKLLKEAGKIANKARVSFEFDIGSEYCREYTYYPPKDPKDKERFDELDAKYKSWTPEEQKEYDELSELVHGPDEYAELEDGGWYMGGWNSSWC